MCPTRGQELCAAAHPVPAGNGLHLWEPFLIIHHGKFCLPVACSISAPLRWASSRPGEKRRGGDGPSLLSGTDSFSFKDFLPLSDSGRGRGDEGSITAGHAHAATAKCFAFVSHGGQVEAALPCPTHCISRH